MCIGLDKALGYRTEIRSLCMAPLASADVLHLYTDGFSREGGSEHFSLPPSREFGDLCADAQTVQLGIRNRARRDGYHAR